ESRTPRFRSSTDRSAPRPNGEKQLSVGIDSTIAQQIESPSPRPSWFAEISEKFHPEIEELKSLAIGTGLAIIRDLVTDSVPSEVSPKLTEVIDHITAKAGGYPIRGSILESKHFPAGKNRGRE